MTVAKTTIYKEKMSGHIKVCCRIRGPLPQAQDESLRSIFIKDNVSSDFDAGDCDHDEDVINSNSSSSIKGKKGPVIVHINTAFTSNKEIKTEMFEVDHGFSEEASQEEIYEDTVKPLVADALTGFNCSLFSYGQTGSGKTHTLIGEASGINRGILSRSVEMIFDSKQSMMEGQKKLNLTVKLSILEIYQEKLKDLLRNPSPSRYLIIFYNINILHNIIIFCVIIYSKNEGNIRIREKTDGIVWVQGLTEFISDSQTDFMKAVVSAMRRRVVGSHNMNAVSSRSHLIFIIHLDAVSSVSPENNISSKLHIIDLAGSEMVRKTDAVGIRFSEAKHINKSLSALGNVIATLSSNSSSIDGDSNR